MKKVIVLLICVIMVFSLSACKISFDPKKLKVDEPTSTTEEINEKEDITGTESNNWNKKDYVKPQINPEKGDFGDFTIDLEGLKYKRESDLSQPDIDFYDCAYEYGSTDDNHYTYLNIGFSNLGDAEEDLTQEGFTKVTYNDITGYEYHEDDAWVLEFERNNSYWVIYVSDDTDTQSKYHQIINSIKLK